MEKINNVSTPADNNSTDTRLLGAQVEEDIYWKFKKIAAMRKETMAEAMTHAALMYITAGGGK